MGKGRGRRSRPRSRRGHESAKKAYSIDYSPDAVDHLDGFSTPRQRLIVETVSEQLRYEPTLETRNRKQLRPNPIAPWELRIGDVRVYYDVSAVAGRLVDVRAIGVKEHNKLRIGGEVVES